MRPLRQGLPPKCLAQALYQGANANTVVHLELVLLSQETEIPIERLGSWALNSAKGYLNCANFDVLDIEQIAP